MRHVVLTFGDEAEMAAALEGRVEIVMPLTRWARRPDPAVEGDVGEIAPGVTVVILVDRLPAALAPHDVTGADVEPLPAGGLVEPPSIEGRRRILRAQVDALRAGAEAQGCLVDLGGGTAFLVDTRNETDFRNIAGLTSFAQVAIAADLPAVLIPFRGADDITRPLTPAQMIALSQAVILRIAGLYDAAWAHKAAIEAAETHTALDLLDFTTGWPA